MADLVIPDLARWQDWSQVKRLAELFRSTDPKTTWVRLPIINYMRVCPLPEAAEALKEFRRLDPAAVEKAMTFYPTLSGAEENGDAGGGDAAAQPDDPSKKEAAAEPNK